MIDLKSNYPAQIKQIEEFSKKHKGKITWSPKGNKADIQIDDYIVIECKCDKKTS